MPDSHPRAARLTDRLRHNGAEVLHADPDNLSQTIIGLIGQQGWHRLVSVRRNRVGHPSVLGDDPPLDSEEIAELDAVITESALAVAELGVVVLDHDRGQGRPTLVTLPKTHVCVVEESAVVDDVATAQQRLDPDRLTTWISGPEAPDGLVAGLHRPESFIVVLVAAS
jgi:L-lactate dehydrogenase complex protein LldG